MKAGQKSDSRKEQRSGMFRSFQTGYWERVIYLNKCRCIRRLEGLELNDRGTLHDPIDGEGSSQQHATNIDSI
jgi:hypothetical protein